ETLQQGLYGWHVTDCVVTLIESGYISPSTTARDFRLLLPLVLMAALREAGTVVLEPMHRYQLEIPQDTLGPVLPVLARLRAVLEQPVLRGTTYLIDGEIPASQVQQLQRELPG